MGEDNSHGSRPIVRLVNRPAPCYVVATIVEATIVQATIVQAVVVETVRLRFHEHINILSPLLPVPPSQLLHRELFSSCSYQHQASVGILMQATLTITMTTTIMTAVGSCSNARLGASADQKAGLFKSFGERDRIMSMREIEREQLLAERREENERVRQNRMLRQLKVNQDKDKKRKASAADLDDGQRKNSRARTKTSDANDKVDTSVRRGRDERNGRKEQRDRDERQDRQDRRRSPSFRRSADRGGDSDVEWDAPTKSKPRSRSPEPREALPADLRDVERVRVGRSRFAEVAFYPDLDKALTGCFVRINIGPNPDTRQDVYRMAVITGIKQDRPYAMPDQTGKPVVVDTYVTAAHGKAVRDWPYFACSDQQFTEQEWNRFKAIAHSEDTPVPTKTELISKMDDINKLVKRTWTEEELTKKLKRQNALRAKFSGADRSHLEKQLERARARGDEEEATKLQEKLDHLETPRLAFRTSLAQKKPSAGAVATQSHQERLAAINAENRRRNSESVRKAQLKERQRARELQMQSRKVDKDDKADAGDAAKSPALAPHLAKLQEMQRDATKNGMPLIHKPLMDDDIIAALELDIDITID